MQEKSTHKKSAGGRAGMDTYEQQSLRRVRKISQTIARDLCHKIPQINGNNVETQSLIGRGERSRRPTCRLPLVDSLITDRANLLLQDASPAMQSRKTILPGKVGDLYLPRITGKLVRGPLSQSCPYLYSRRRGSVSSILSHRSSDCSTQGPARTQKISSSSRSNVMVTMTYLGQKFSGTSLDEMKVLQQICGGENICVFKGPVRPGEQFQFISQRHLAYPFSATFYVNGIIAGRISSCCEYRYTPGLQQGQKSCFRLSRLTGGKPCYRCVNARLSIVQPVQKPKEAPIDPHLYPDVLESRTSSPLFVPVGMERDARRTKTHPTDRISMSTDSEDIAHNTKERGPAKRQKDHQSQKKDSKRSVASQTHKEPNPPGGGPSMSKPQGLQQGSRSGGKVNPPEGRKSPEAEQKKLLTGLCDKSTNTLEEPSEMISTNEAAHKLEPNVASDGSPTTQEDPRKEPDLQKQLGAMVEVLKNSDEVDQLVLRNTGLTDTLLQDLADALKSSLSEVTMINLNLNHIGPSGVNTLLELIRSKPHLKSLFIFGNQLGDSGVQALLLGLAELQYKTIWATEAPSQSEATPAATVEPQLPAFTGFSLRELDLGGNSMGGAGLRVLATYLRRHSQLQYLGLGQTSDPDGAAWADLFDSLKANAHLAHIILDECGLGDHGVKLFAEALKASMSLSKVDLDGNGIAESGGNAILEALVSRRHSPLQHLSIEEGNYITTALMMKILQEMNRLAPL